MFFKHALPALLLASVQYAGNSAAHIAARGTVAINNFDYTPVNGPLTWFRLPNSGLCKTGKNQSPILLDSSIATVPKGTLVFKADKQKGELANKGSAIEVDGVKGSITYQNTVYEIQNFHYHTPSEHRINKEYYPIETHFVTKSAAGKFLVLGLVIQLAENKENDLVKTALAKVSSIKPGFTTETGNLDFSEITKYVKNNALYTYGGSLTTPPCSEGLSWFVGTEPIYASVATYNALKAAVKYNARLIQAKPGSTNVIVDACTA